MDERHYFRSNETLEDYLGNPYLILAYEIFRQALADCKDWTYHDELKKFAASAWCSFLLMGAMPKEEIIEHFDREMKAAPKKHIDKHYGFCNKPTAIYNERLQAVRMSRGFTRAAVAKMMDIKPTKIEYWERRGVYVPKKALQIMCELYGCSEDYIKEINK